MGLSYEEFLASQKKPATKSLLYSSTAKAPVFENTYKPAPVTLPTAKPAAAPTGGALSYETFLATQAQTPKAPTIQSSHLLGSTQPVNFNNTYKAANQSVPTTAGFAYKPPPLITPKPAGQSLQTDDSIFPQKPELRTALTKPAIDAALKAFDALDLFSGTIAFAPARATELAQGKKFGSSGVPLRFSEGAQQAANASGLPRAATVPVGIAASIIGDPLNLVGGGAKSGIKGAATIKKLLHPEDLTFATKLVTKYKAKNIPSDKDYQVFRAMFQAYKVQLPPTKKATFEFVDTMLNSADTAAETGIMAKATAVLDYPATAGGSKVNVPRPVPKVKPSFLKVLRDQVTGQFKGTMKLMREQGERGFVANPFANKADELSTEMSFYQDALSASPARALVKKFGPRVHTTSLDEILASSMGKQGISARLDSIVTDLGYPDVATAQRALDDYKGMQARVKEITEELKALRKTEKPPAPLPVKKLEAPVTPKETPPPATPPRPPRTTREIVEPPSPQGTKLSTFRKFFTSGRKILEKSGPSGQEMSKILEKQRLHEDLLSGEYLDTIRQALKDLSKDERSTITAALEGDVPVRELPEKLTAAYAKMRSMLDKIAYRAEDTGFEVRIGQGGPKVPFKRRENYFPRQYDLDALAKGKRRQEALEHLVATGQARNLPEAEKLLDEFLIKNAERRAGNLENARMLDLPGYERDPLIALPKYTRSVAKRFTESDFFGKKDEVIAGLIKRITREGGDYNEAQRIFDFIVDGPPQNKFVSAITQFNTATKLSLSFIVNVTQTQNTMSKAGIRATAKGIVKGFSAEGKRLADLTNAYDDFILVKELGMEPHKLVRGVMYVFKKVEEFNRRTAAMTGKIRAQELVKKLKADPQSRYALRQLESLGIDPQKVMTSGLSDQQLLIAANKMIEKTQFRIDPLEVPPSWRTPLGRLLSQFRSFTFMQTKFVRDEILAEARQGNFLPMITFVTLAVPASYVVAAIRAKLTGREEGNIDIREWDKWMKAFGTIPTDAIIQSKFLIDTFKSDLKTPIEKGTRAASSVLGPTVDEAGKFLGGVERIRHQQEANKYLRTKGKEVDPYLGLKRQAIEKIPFVGQFLKNKFFSYPKSTTTPERKESNKVLYDNVDKWLDKPYGDAGVKKEVLDYVQGLADDDERNRQLFILRENGIDTSGISSSKAINDMRPTYDKVQEASKAGDEAKVQKLLDAMSEDDYETYKKIRASERSKNTAKLRELLLTEDPEAVTFLRSQTPKEKERLLEVMTDEEYAVYEGLKNSYKPGLNSNQFIGIGEPDQTSASAIQWVNKQLKDKTSINKVKDDVLTTFPWTDLAKSEFKDAKFTPLSGAPEGVRGAYYPAGYDIFAKARKLLSDEMAALVSNEFKHLDKPEITLKPGLKDAAAEVLTHEMLHHAFDQSPMGRSNDEAANMETLGNAWLQTWEDADYDRYPILREIDDHISSHYSSFDNYSLATERYAYLGARVLDHGITAIPPQFRKFYINVIEGSKRSQQSASERN